MSWLADSTFYLLSLGSCAFLHLAVFPYVSSSFFHILDIFKYLIGLSFSDDQNQTFDCFVPLTNSLFFSLPDFSTYYFSMSLFTQKIALIPLFLLNPEVSQLTYFICIVMTTVSQLSDHYRVPLLPLVLELGENITSLLLPYIPDP